MHIFIVMKIYGWDPFGSRKMHDFRKILLYFFLKNIEKSPKNAQKSQNTIKVLKMAKFYKKM